MAGKSPASELLELASEVLTPRQVRGVQRVINSAQRARGELGELLELVTFADTLDQPELVEIAPGVFVPKPRTALGKLRELQRWQRSR